MPVLVRGKRVETQQEASQKAVEAARWRGMEIRYLEDRIVQLRALRAVMDRWLDANPAHHLWHWRNSRAIAVLMAVRRHEERIRMLIAKVEQLTAGRSQQAEQAITRAFFDARHAPPPDHRPHPLGFEHNGDKSCG